jgi:hypothetical protein
MNSCEKVGNYGLLLVSDDKKMVYGVTKHAISRILDFTFPAHALVMRVDTAVILRIAEKLDGGKLQWNPDWAWKEQRAIKTIATDPSKFGAICLIQGESGDAFWDRLLKAEATSEITIPHWPTQDN